MGLAASQARFLGLTARKSNAEYKAQQINQQRTALSNEVAKMYQDYNNLEVPVPPSSTDYVKTTYKVDNTDENYEIKNYEKITDTTSPYYGYYRTTLEYQDSKAKCYPAISDVNMQVKGDFDSSSSSLSGIDSINLTIGTDTYTYDKNDEENSTIKRLSINEDGKVLNSEGKDITDQYQGLSGVISELGDAAKGTDIYYYSKDGVNYYTTKNDLASTAYDYDTETKTGKYNGQYSFTYQGSESVTKEVNAIAAINTNSSGRLSSIAIIACDDDQDLVGLNSSITTSQEDDTKGFEDATNEYNYQRQIYEKEVQRINNKTEQLQQEDRQLELQIDQIDTEQNALQTEMDSIKKVIENTTKSIFETYSGS